MSAYHKPVLLKESLDALNVQADGVYVDVTFGGGGHSTEILKRLSPKGRLMSFDLDPDAASNLLDDKRFIFINQNYRYLTRFLRLYNIEKIDGLLADLGVSSFQLDEESRGFTYRVDAALDMRMNQSRGKTAADVLNEYSAEELQRILGEYANVRNARTLAKKIVAQRQISSFRTTGELISILEPISFGNHAKYYAQVFQALRIEVNEELEALKEMLAAAGKAMKIEANIAVITYHSVEDRIVKRYFQNRDDAGEVSDEMRSLKPIKGKFIVPSDEEILENRRARSAKLRVAQKYA